MKFIRSFVYAAMYAVAVVSCTPKVISLKSESIHLALGNPSGASVNPATSDNYLLLKPQYALSYNRSKGHANWVAWELSQKWLGTIDRQNDFKPDDSLPSVWNKITPNAYSNSGFDRGHLCPSADRTQSAADNSATFLMTNMVPQAPELNREAWAYLEEFCRDLVSEKHKLYIIAGTYGSGGEGSKGNETKLKNTVNVPARIYKIITILPENGTFSDFTADTPVIAVDFPNKNSAVKNTGWIRYITTVNDLEKNTGFDFFSTLPASLQSSLQNKRFDYQNTSLRVDTKCGVHNGNTLYIGKSGGCYYLTASGKKTYVERELCQCQ